MTYLVTAWSTCQLLPGQQQTVTTMPQLHRLLATLASQPHIAYIAIRIIHTQKPHPDQLSLPG